MPAASGYTPDDQDLRNAGVDERVQRQTAANKALNYYAGLHRKPFTVKAREPDLNVVVNLFKMRVDRQKDFLFPQLPAIELGDDSDDAATADEEWLASAWKANSGSVLAGEMAHDGALFGHVYVRILEPNPRNIYPRLRLLNNVITYWDADDVNTPLWHETQWTVGKVIYRQDILDLETLGMGEGWEIRQYQCQRSDVSKPFAWSSDGVIPWTFDCPPVVDWQHWPKPRSYYGGDETGDLALNDSINRVLSQANAVIRNHAFPKTVATGVGAGKVNVATAIDSFWTIDNPGAKVFNLEMQSDLGAIMNMAKALQDAYTSQGRVVLLSGQPSEFARLTNLAVRTVFMDMINANRTLRATYSKGICDLSLAMLTMAGRNADYEPELDWEDALPENDYEQAQVIQLLRSLGLISKESAAGEVGLDWQQEQERMEDETSSNDDIIDKLIKTGGNNPFQLPGTPQPGSALPAPPSNEDGSL